MKKLMFLTGIAAFLMLSCAESGDNTNFWAHNMKTDSAYRLEAELFAQGKYCTVWVEKGSGVNRDTAQKVANEFDNNIYTKMISAFGEIIHVQGYNLNPIELADALTDGDGKLCILFLDIKDDYVKGSNEQYVGGYFSPGDLFEGPNSNYRDMIYIDTYPGKPGSAESNKTLAHELQHLMNLAITLINRDELMDTWIDEGLSGAAEYVYSGTHSQDRVNWYNYKNTNSNIKSLISEGNNFFVWGNREGSGSGKSIYAAQDDYATTYLFFQWLRIQSSKDTGIYKDIIKSVNADYKAVTAAAASSITGGSYSNNNWANLLNDWLAANYICSSNGLYGYKGSLSLTAKHNYPTTGTNINASLYPGEGVYSTINAAFVQSDSGNIKYTYIANNAISNSNSITSGVLLTYNVNTTNTLSTLAASGAVTGVATSVNVDAPVNGRFVSAPTLTGPFRVSGGDVLRRNGRAGNLSPAGIHSHSIRIVINDE
jgi:hypothetical protein